MAESGKSTVVSVKTNVIAGRKRKVDELESIHNGGKEKKKNRRSTKKNVKNV